ncbi:AAA family ATPase [Phytohalomonas tamaricis]|uniref:AAA family ATPase n=1 Tax=Phytohalomonas tamaricis TaxID=2081032 RepID=UPI000D0BCF2F|nr:AAA family ATPase [Phytohalomonas tamaricis]
MTQESSSHVRVQLFGSFELRLEGQLPTPFSYDKVKALLLYLLLHDQAVSRAALAEVLWPDQKAASSRTNLRHALHSLRQTLGAEAERVLIVSRQTLSLQHGERWRLDVGELDALLRNTNGAGTLERVLEIYKGELADGLQLPQCPAFQRWLLQTRSAWRQRVLDCAEQLLEHESNVTIEILRMLVQRFDSYTPFQERLVQKLAESGQAAAAHEQFNAHLQQLTLTGQQPPSSFLKLAHFWTGSSEYAQSSFVNEVTTLTPTYSDTPLDEEEVNYRQLSVMVMRLTLISEQHNRRWERDCFQLQRELMRWLEHQCHHLGGFWLPGAAGGMGMACFGTNGPTHQLAELVALYEHCRLQLPDELARRWQGEDEPPQFELSAGLHSGRVLYIPNRHVIDPQGRVTQPALELMSAAKGSELVISPVASQHMPPALDLQPRLSMRILAANGEVRLRALVLGSVGRGEITPPKLIGRTAEIRQLQDALARVGIGLRQSVLIRGESGMGKSALMVYFRLLEQSQNVELCWLATTRMSSQEPFGLVRSILRWRLGGHFDTPAIEALVAQNAAASRWDENTRALLLQLLGLNEPGQGLSYQSGEAIELMIKTLQLVIEARTIAHPLIIMIDDLQWLDEASLKVLAGLHVRLPIHKRLLLIGSYPGKEAALPIKFHWDQQIILGRLDTAHIAELLNYLVRRYRLQLGPRLRHQLIERCDGVPLYLHELCRRLDLDRREGRPIQIEKLPGELFGLLSSRIDQLEQYREVAYVAAVIGKQFRSGMLRDCLQSDSTFLKQALERMQRLEIIEPCAQAEGFDYQFCHQLLQEAAYLACPEEVRRKIHNHLVEVIEQDFPTWLGRHPGYFAMHLSKSGRFARSARYFELAARDALRVSANRTALKMADDGLECLEQMEGKGYIERKVSLLIIKGQAGFALEGHGSSVALKSFQSGRHLLGEYPVFNDEDEESLELRFLVHWGLWVGCIERQALSEAREITQQLQTLATNFEDVRYSRLALYAAALCDYWSGNLDRAFELFDALDPLNSNMTFEWLPYSEHPQVSACAYQAWVWCWQGSYEKAQYHIEAAIRMAERINHPGTLALVLICSAWLYRQLGHFHLAHERAQRAAGLTHTPDLNLLYLSARCIEEWWKGLGGDESALATQEGLLEQSMEMFGPDHYRHPKIWYVDTCLALRQFDKAKIYLEQSVAKAREQKSLYLPELLLLLAKSYRAQHEADTRIPTLLEEARCEALQQRNTHMQLLILEARLDWFHETEEKVRAPFSGCIERLEPSSMPLLFRLRQFMGHAY